MTAQPRDGLLVAPESELGKARELHPHKGVRIARTEAERLLDVRLGFLAATDKKLADTDHWVSTGQTSI